VHPHVPGLLALSWDARSALELKFSADELLRGIACIDLSKSRDWAGGAVELRGQGGDQTRFLHSRKMLHKRRTFSDRSLAVGWRIP